MDSVEQFSIPKDAKNPELAKEFLRFLYTDDSVRSRACQRRMPCAAPSSW